MSVKVAVLALQGDFEKHILRLRELDADAFAARTSGEIESADAIVIPGGESTTIGKLMARYGIDISIKRASSQGKPIFGTCAGMILMAKQLDTNTAERGGQPLLELMDITVARNAYGRQIDSFETEQLESELTLRGTKVATLEAVFIRAPAILSVGANVQILASYNDAPVLVRQDNLLAAAFHPEMTSDTTVHEYFLAMAESKPERPV